MRRTRGDSHTSLILLIVMISITVSGAAILYSFQQRTAAVPISILSESLNEGANGLVVTNVIGTDDAGNDLSAMRIQVRYEGEGEGELDINDTYIKIRMDDSQADLRYRNGTLERDIGSGFYTQ